MNSKRNSFVIKSILLTGIVTLLLFITLFLISVQPVTIKSTVIQDNKGIVYDRSGLGKSYSINTIKTNSGKLTISGSDFSQKYTKNHKLKDKIKVQKYKGTYIPTSGIKITQYKYLGDD